MLQFPALCGALLRRKAASGIDYAVLAALIAIAVLGAVVLTGERVRSFFVASDATVSDGIAGLPLPEPPPPAAPGGGGPPPAGQGAWSGDGAFALDPLSTPQARSFTLTNVGDAVLPLGAPSLSGPGAGAFQILASDCGPLLLPGDACTLTVEAQALANGIATATLAIGGVPGGIPLSRTATGFDPLLAWSGTPTFALDGTPGPQPLPRTAQQTFTLTNQGFADAPGIAPALGGPDAAAFAITASSCPSVLTAGTSCTVTVAAQATDNGILTATLAAGGPATLDLGLTATATGFAPALAWSGTPTFVLDGTPGPDPLPRTATQTFTLTNVGTAPATGLSVAVSGTGFAAGLPATTCTTTLAVGAACTFTVQASATTNDTFNGTLSSGGPAPATQALAATADGFAATFAWSGGSPFTLTAPTETPSTLERTFTLTNTGTLAGTPPTPTVSGSGAGFAYSLVSHTCDTALSVGGACQATVRATYTDNVATATGTLAAGDATQALIGSATGFAAALAWTTVPADFSLNATNGGVAQPATTTPGPTQTATVTNTGTLPTGPLAIALAGPNATAFEIVSDPCVGAPLAPGASCSVGVRLVAGLFPGDYTLQMTATGSPTATTPARPQRVVGPRLQIVFDAFDAGNPATLDHASWSAFGNAREIRYQNVGNASTGPMGATNLAPAGFTFNHAFVGGPTALIDAANPTGTVTLDPGQTARLRVRLQSGSFLNTNVATLVAGPNTFTAPPNQIGGFPLPAISGVYTGTVAFAWSGGGSFDINNPTTVPAIVERTFTLTNSGSLPATPPVPTVTGTGTGFSFSFLSTDCGPSRNPGQVCTTTVRATYTDAATASGTLSAGAATQPLAGVGSGCSPGDQVFTASGTFTRPGFFAACGTVRILAIGGGGGGGAGHNNGGQAGGGGGSGIPTTTTVAAGSVPATVAVTVGTGGAGGDVGQNGANGGSSAFGAFLTANGGSGGFRGHEDHPFPSRGGNGGSGGGAMGRNGGTDGATPPSNTHPHNGNVVVGGTGIGPFPSASLFARRTVAPAAGGLRASGTPGSPNPGFSPYSDPNGWDSSDSRLGGGGGGGMTISDASPAQSATAGTAVTLPNLSATPWIHPNTSWSGDAWVTSGGFPGGGFGGGGGAGSRHLGVGGRGADGVVYIEWR